jgi:RNA polymerase sigma-70 factor (ECF subfamily)
MDQTKEAILVRQAQSGDGQAVVALYQQFIAPIYRYVYSKVSNRQVTEDITSEVFLKMIKQLPKFAGRSSFKNWLYQIAKNTIADYWRQHYRTPTVSLELIQEINLLEKDPPQDIEREAGIKETKINTILSSLPDNYREVLELRFIRNYTLQETSDALQISLANAKVLQYRALKKACELSKNV